MRVGLPKIKWRTDMVRFFSEGMTASTTVIGLAFHLND